MLNYARYHQPPPPKESDKVELAVVPIRSLSGGNPCCFFGTPNLPPAPQQPQFAVPSTVVPPPPAPTTDNIVYDSVDEFLGGAPAPNGDASPVEDWSVASLSDHTVDIGPPPSLDTINGRLEEDADKFLKAKQDPFFPFPSKYALRRG